MQDILSMSNDLEALRRLSQVSIGGRSPVAFLCQRQRRPGKERGRRLSFLPRGPPSFPAPPSPHLQRAGSAPRREPGKGGVRRHPPSDRRRQAPRATQHARARRVPSTQGRGCDLSPRPKMRPVQKKKKKKKRHDLLRNPRSCVPESDSAADGKPEGVLKQNSARSSHTDRALFF